ncbi:MAG: hypothetical protein AMXMBFR53_39700 [Gemmatimonadota bacterium]
MSDEHKTLPQWGTFARRSFVATFLVAASASAILSWVSAPAWMPAVFSGLVMLSYLVGVRVLEPELYLDREFADGFYFLGFLLTLVALVLVLLQIEPAEGASATSVAASEALPRVLGQFGLALSSTILGLLVRTYLTLFRGMPQAEEERAYLELAGAADRLRMVLGTIAGDASTSLGRIKTEIGQSVDQLNLELGRVTGKVNSISQRFGVVEDRLGEVVVSLEKTRDAIAAAGVALQGQIDGTGRALTGAATSLGTVVTNVASNGRTFVGDLERIQESLRGSSEELRTAMVATGTAISDIGAAAGQVDSSSWKTLAEALAGFSPAIQAGLESLEGSVRRIAVQAEKQADLDEATAQARVGFQVQAAELAQVVEAWRAAAAGAKGLVESYDSLREAVGGVGSVFARQQPILGSAMDSWQRSVSSLDEVSQTIASKQGAAARDLERVREELAASVAFLRSLMDPADA